MAITNYKKIEDNKGFFVNEKDRKIFEKEISKGYFGFDDGDVIEFIVYDSSDNPLPQESAQGKPARYIQYNPKTKREYFGKTQINKQNIKSNDSDEFFIDTEKLLKEAGYSQGIFKTTISLLNRRLGSSGRENDSVWIHQISPSRTEIRLLPTFGSDGKPNDDLEERYKAFVDCRIFRADVLPFIDEFVEQFDVQKSIEEMIKLNGTVSDGQNYIGLIESEFKLNSFDNFVERVKEKFVQAVNYFKSNRDFNILSNRYGQPLQTEPQISYSVDGIYNDIVNIVSNCIEFYLPKRNIREETSLTIEQQKTLDEVEQILNTVRSNENYNTSVPPSVQAKVRGCKDPNALNYNSNADIDDRSLCVYKPVVVVEENPPLPKPPLPKPQPPRISLSDRIQPELRESGNLRGIELPVELFSDTKDILNGGSTFDDELPSIISIDFGQLNPFTTPTLTQTDTLVSTTFNTAEPIQTGVFDNRPISGENDQGNQPIVSRRSDSQPLGSAEFSNPRDAIENEFQFRQRNTQRER